jgi:RNA polymerase sigma factor (sigma-70 family)
MGADASGPPPLTPEQLVQVGLPIMRECAVHVARRFLGRVTPEELYATGAEALQEAARTYDLEHHVRFQEYAKHHVRGRMIDAVKAELFSLEARVEQSMERAYEILAGHHVLDCDFFRDDESKLADAASKGADQVAAATFIAAVQEEQGADVEEAMAMHLTLQKAMASLYTVEREAVHLVAEEGMTLDEAAKELRVHANTVQRRYTRGLEKIRAFLAEVLPRAGPGG